jgi:predicted acyltransferase
MGKINPDGWVAINAIPTAAHTIWGMLAGKLLISKLSPAQKITYLIIAGLIGLSAGFALDLLNITPIIKRISTSSFTLASGGWIMLFLAFFYWLVDVKHFSKYAWVFTVVGMNAVFIYLFFETVGSQWFNGFVAIFIRGTLGFTPLPHKVIDVFSAITVLALEWYICYWLSKQKIYVKI